MDGAEVEVDGAEVGGTKVDGAEVDRAEVEVDGAEVCGTKVDGAEVDRAEMDGAVTKPTHLSNYAFINLKFDNW